MMLSRAVLVTATATAALATVANDARGATVASSRPCVTSKSPGQFVATGFTPGAAVEIGGDALIGASQGVAGPDGSLTAPFESPLADPTVEAPTPFSFQATDGKITATGSALLVTPGLIVPQLGFTRVQMRIRLTGYNPGRTLYAHLRWGRKWRRTVKLGTATAPCGSIDTKRKLLRKTAGPRGRQVYVQFDSSRRPARDTHQTAYARFTVSAAAGRNKPERYLIEARGWRERTGI